MNIVILEDNDTLRQGLETILAQQDHQVAAFANPRTGMAHIRISPPDLVITDHRMDGLTGLGVLEACQALPVRPGVIVITAFGSIELAVEAMKQGAWDFITKPFNREALLLKIDRFDELRRQRETSSQLASENRHLKEELIGRLHYGEMVGDAPSMKAVYATLEKAAPTETSVLITGESGTGKELAARAIHRLSRRSEHPFVRVNCSALAENLLESELFGHEKGAFTGAVRQKKGRFELAHGGTLFLDEIGDISLSLQTRLLRVLQEKEFERVGGEQTLKVDVRIIAATHQDLAAAVKAGTFREDLFYRLFIVPLHLPPLRERKEDIPQLAGHFLKALSEELGRPLCRLEPQALELLKAYHWPGNVRELSNVLERAVVLSTGEAIKADSLVFLTGHASANQAGGLNLEGRLAALERELIQSAMDATGHVKTRAAQMLGIKTSALYYKLEKYGLTDEAL